MISSPSGMSSHGINDRYATVEVEVVHETDMALKVWDGSDGIGPEGVWLPKALCRNIPEDMVPDTVYEIEVQEWKALELGLI